MKHKKKMKFLLDISLSSGKLDPEKIAFIAKGLSRKELGNYLSLLERKWRNEKITVVTSVPLPKAITKNLEKLFAGKEVFFQENPSILAGMKVAFADYIFDASFKRYLENVKKHYEVN